MYNPASELSTYSTGPLKSNSTICSPRCSNWRTNKFMSFLMVVRPQVICRRVRYGCAYHIQLLLLRCCCRFGSIDFLWLLVRYCWSIVWLFSLTSCVKLSIFPALLALWGSCSKASWYVASACKHIHMLYHWFLILMCWKHPPCLTCINIRNRFTKSGHKMVVMSQKYGMPPSTLLQVV